MEPDQITTLFLALGTVLGVARVLGEVARRFNQPAVMGEILAGIVLGPTVLGRVAPNAFAALFPSSGPLTSAMSAISILAVTLFLLIAGLEVNFASLRRQGRSAAWVSLSGIVIPFVIGFGLAQLAPVAMGAEPGTNRSHLAPEHAQLVFSLFFATALSISALPVIARTLMDLNLLRSDFGMVIVASAVVDDLVGWIIFAAVLGMMGGRTHGPSLLGTVGLTLAYATLILTVGRWLVHRAVTWLEGNTSRSGGVLGFAVTFGLLCAAFTEWIGLHAVFGSFLCGVAIGDSKQLRERARGTLDQFVSFIFAPLFFGSIGLKVDFFQHFDVLLVLTVLLVATAGKVLGVGLAARLTGTSWRLSWATGFAMNARGAMEIILGLLALQQGIIGHRMFVALVVMALVTSMLSGPIMQHLLGRKRHRRFTDFLQARAFIPKLLGATAEAVIGELAAAAAPLARLPRDDVESAVLRRERMMATGLEYGVALPHARLSGLATPVVAMGLSTEGVAFGTMDGSPARIVVLVLMPEGDSEAELQVLADVARTFADPTARREALSAATHAELRAALGAADPVAIPEAHIVGSAA